jgi:hypothetical protein
VRVVDVVDRVQVVVVLKVVVQGSVRRLLGVVQVMVVLL